MIVLSFFTTLSALIFVPLSTIFIGSLCVLSALLRAKDVEGGPYDYLPRTWAKMVLAVSGVRVVVHDNGMGIAPELLTRIFQYGFTTREEGHGFGLHSSALAAQELGGSLAVHSDGPGKGATFTLEMPYHPA